MCWCFNQIIPTVPHSPREVPLCRNPISPALRLHFDSALVNPLHDRKVVRNIVRVCEAFVAKSKVSTRCRKSNLLLLSLTEQPGSPRDGIAARGPPELGAAVRRNRQCAGLGEQLCCGGRREVFPLRFTGGIPCVWVQGAKLSCVGSRDEVLVSHRRCLHEVVCEACVVSRSAI
jgi:hypothetical protein